MSGDFAQQNESRVVDALEHAVRDSARAMIDQLADRGITMAYFERALQLPQRTLARWKDGGCAAAGIAVLRLIRTYPWLLRVADHGFSEAASQGTLITEGAAAYVQALARQAPLIHSFAPTIGWSQTTPEFAATMHGATGSKAHAS
jgi:hypothetical protein